MWVTMARITLWEATRKRFSLVAVLATVAFLGLLQWLLSALQANLTSAGPAGAVSEPLAATLLLSLSLFFAYVMIAFFAILALSSAITGEVESGALLAVATRPLSRASLYFGRLAGYGALATAYAVVLVSGVMLLVHLHFPTVSTVWRTYPLVLGLFVLESWLMAALTMLGSVWLSALANGLVISGLFFAAFLLGSITQLPFAPSLGDTGIIANVLWPSDALYRLALYHSGVTGALTPFLGPFGVAHPPSALFILYVLAYVAAVTWAGMAAFARKDL